MLLINIYGPPIAWKRPAHKLLGGRVIVFDSQKKDKEAARRQMKAYYPSDYLLDCPMSIEMDFFFKIPASTSKKKRERMLENDEPHVSKPDVDNCLKFYMDCLTGTVIVDDNIVYAASGHKYYSESDSVYIKIVTYQDEAICDFCR
jgi:Holliday junction resolvase RusA-like endonuclease